MALSRREVVTASPARAAAPARRPRDLRIDFFRGLALVGIAVNHVAPPPKIVKEYGHYQFGHLFSFNFADVFVFVSGFVCAMAYGSTLRGQGLWAAQKKALGRCRQIYGMYWLALLATVAAMTTLRAVAGPVDVVAAMRFDPATFLDTKTLLLTALMRPPLTHFGILEFYVIMLSLMPAALWLYDRRPWLVTALTLGMYTYAQGATEFGWSGLTLTRGPFGNYLAWQLLFFGGLFLSVEARRGRLPRVSNAGVLALVGLLIGVDYLRQTKWVYYHLAEKQSLGPIRVLELLAVLGIVARHLPAETRALGTGAAGLVARAGKQGLGVFAWTLFAAHVLSYAAARLDVGRGGYLLTVVASAASALACGLLLHGAAERRRPPASEQPGQPGEGEADCRIVAGARG